MKLNSFKTPKSVKRKKRKWSLFSRETFDNCQTLLWVCFLIWGFYKLFIRTRLEYSGSLDKIIRDEVERMENLIKQQKVELKNLENKLTIAKTSTGRKYSFEEKNAFQNCVRPEIEFTMEKMQSICSNTNVVYHSPYQCSKPEKPDLDIALSLINHLFDHCDSFCLYHWMIPTKKAWFYNKKGYCWEPVNDLEHQCLGRWTSAANKAKEKVDKFCLTNGYFGHWEKEMDILLDIYFEKEIKAAAEHMLSEEKKIIELRSELVLNGTWKREIWNENNRKVKNNNLFA